MTTHTPPRLPLLYTITPSRAESAREFAALATTFAALALDEQSPVALELAATSSTRHFLLRATSEFAAQHLVAQIQARYPQSVITEATTDPLVVAQDDEYTVWELAPGASQSLPLQHLKERELQTEGADPLLGVLAALAHVPTRMRAVAQLALTPAPSAWSAQLRRTLALQEQEMQQGREWSGQTSKPATPTFASILLLLLLLGGLWTYVHILPIWAKQAVMAFFQGKTVPVTHTQMVQVMLWAGGILFGGFVVTLLIRRLQAVIAGPTFPDLRMIKEKTDLPAYRVRLRLYVLMQGEQQLTPLWVAGFRQVGRWKWRNIWETGFSALPRNRLQLSFLARDSKALFIALYRVVSLALHLRISWLRRAWARRKLRRNVLLGMTTAYKQFHLATGGYFVPMHYRTGHAKRLLTPGSSWWRKCGWTVGLRHSRHYLSVADVAALWHLPQAHDLTALTFVESRVSKTILVPSALTSAHAAYRIGTSSHAGITAPVYLPYTSLRQNLLAVASTGKGKSTGCSISLKLRYLRV